MRIGIVTITDRENYGNRLQNYAVQRILQSLGHDVETIRKIRYKESVIQKIKNIIKYSTGIKYNRYAKRIRKFSKFNKSYINFSKSFIKSDHIDYKLSDKYDLFVCGSDQLWNPNFSFNSYAEYLSFVIGKKKIAISASFGVRDIATNRDDIKKYLGDFHAISVREKRGSEIIKELTGKEAVVLSDPTAVLTAEDWKQIQQRPKHLANKKYIVCYLLGNYGKQVIKDIRNYARKEELEIVFLESDFYYYKITTEEEFACGPCEFVWLINNAEKVITDSFHATMFSLLFKKNFLVVSEKTGHSSMSSRFEQLKEAYKLDNFYVENSDYSKKPTIDYEVVDNVLKEKREEFLDFLKDNI